MSGILQAFAYGRAFTSAPVNTVAPVVSGTATFGQTLSCTTGTWTGIPTPTFTYQWQRVTTNISGATSSTYVLVQADVGSTIRCVVTATNSTAAVSANSNNTAAVIATVPGTPTIGTATATGASTATVTYTAPASNGGANITSYTAISTPGSITGSLSTSGSGTITVSGLSGATAYTFKVYATNSVGNSSQSAASNSITTATPNMFAGLYNLASTGNITTDSSGNVYQWLYSNAQRATLAKYTSSNTLTSVVFQNPQDVSDGGTIIDSSGNIIVAYSNNIFKMNSSFTVSWGKLLTGYYAVSSNPIAIDSSNRVFIACNWYENFGKYSNPGSAVLVYNSDGSSPRYWVLSASNPNPYTWLGLSIPTSTNNLVFYADVSSGYKPGVYLVNNPGSGTPLLENTNTASNTAGFNNGDRFVTNGYGMGGYNVADNSHWIIGTRQNSGTSPQSAVFVKFNSAGAYSGVMGNIGNSNTRGAALAFDSSGNVYMYLKNSGDNITSWIVKYNSSGVIQWQRQFVLTGSNTSFNCNIRPKLALSGSTLYVGMYVGLSSNAIGCTLSYPTDGSKTGAVSVTSTYLATVTITASSLTTSTQTMTAGYQNWSAPYNGTTPSSGGYFTGTFANASYTSAITTY